MGEREHVGEIMRVEYRDADGDLQMARLTPQGALALCQALADGLNEWADTGEDDGD